MCRYVNAIDKLTEMLERPDAVRLLKPRRACISPTYALLLFSSLGTDTLLGGAGERRRLRMLTETMKKQAMRVSVRMHRTQHCPETRELILASLCAQDYVE